MNKRLSDYIKLIKMIVPNDIDIKISGLRPGEKLFEELLTNEENTIPTYNKKILIAKTHNLNYKEIKNKIEDLISLDEESPIAIVTRLKAIIPEYISNNSEFEALDGKSVKVKKLKIG